MGWWSSGTSGSREDSESHPNGRHSSDKEEREQSPFVSPPPSQSPVRPSPPSKPTNRSSSFNAFDLSQFAEPRNLIPTLLLTGGILFAARIYRRYLHRFPEATDITSSYFRQRSLFGRVTSVGDGDNFRMYHTPGGRLVGWDWLPWMKVPTSRKELKDKTIHVRLAGVDAPELSHFGRPAQPYAQEAHIWLTSYLLNRRVRVYIHRPDQYKRVIATVYVRRWLDFPPLRRRDASHEMLKRGLATVYEAKSGVEFGGTDKELRYREAERVAKARKLGLWRDFWRYGGINFESPREYKTRMGQELPLEIQPESSSSKKETPGFIVSLARRIFPSRFGKNGK